MIISQSFKTKLENGSFGEETFLSTKSDLVFMSDKDGNSQSLTERIAGENGIEASIAVLNEELTQEIEDRIAAVAQEEEDRIEAVAAEASFREAAIAQEVKDRNAAIAAESALRVAEEKRIESLITTETAERKAAITQEISDRNAAIAVETENRTKAIQSVEDKVDNLADTLGPQVEAANTAVNDLNTRVTTLEESNPTILADIANIKTEIGELDVDDTGAVISIATQLADIIARLEVIEAQLSGSV